MVGVMVMGILSASLYAGLSFGFTQIRLAREDERATQVLAERMEVVRLLNWDQLVNIPGYIPTTFKDSYSLANPTNAPAGALVYSGTVVVTNVPSSATYTNDMRMIKISLTWTSGKLTHSRSMTTLVSRYGLQNYVY